MDPPPVCFYDQLCACMRVCVQIGWFRINGYSEIVKTTLNGERAIYPDRVYPRWTYKKGKTNNLIVLCEFFVNRTFAKKYLLLLN